MAHELERLGALMAVYGKPSFNCATARRPAEKAICADPDLANLDREIYAANVKAVREATADGANEGRALQREQDAFLAQRNSAFGQPGYDLYRALDHALHLGQRRLNRHLHLGKRLRGLHPVIADALEAFR